MLSVQSYTMGNNRPSSGCFSALDNRPLFQPQLSITIQTKWNQFSRMKKKLAPPRAVTFRRTPSATAAKLLIEAEIEELFAVVEKKEQKRFLDKFIRKRPCLYFGCWRANQRFVL
ncbi:uncharacterized protein LOC110938454 isoform X2 [Helianthus annuus]|uniref:uncharacterized protein LOC110938454 isoform X2 n=1 Tax=Helianthus annuus TaxID=4232 RepID=UPI0016531A1B|nr:uncharacterized protein LOC110938454 isoform X2 [Helianthus annuus]